MAKKKKKKVRARKEKRREEKIIVSKPSPAPAVKVPERPALRVDFRKEYPYIYSDLRRAGITALAMFVFMLLISLIVR